MDFFQGVVSEYLRADRATFVNTECLLQLEPGDAPARGTSWYCDAVAVNFRDHAVYLCEVTYASTLQALVTRLEAWGRNWPGLCAAIVRDCGVPADWRVQPWVFIPEERHALLRAKLSTFISIGDAAGYMPAPRVTYLESVVPWKYRSWDRKIAALETDG